MDNNQLVSDVHGLEPISEDLRDSSPSAGDVEIRELVLTQEKTAELLLKYQALTMPKIVGDVFLAHLMRRDSWFVEVGNIGIIYLSDVIPGLSAQLHFYFWDMKLTPLRQNILRQFLRMAFDNFALERIGTVVYTFPRQRHYDGKGPGARFRTTAGFKLEGVVRMAYVHEGELLDITLFGMLKDECQWQLQTTSSD